MLYNNLRMKGLNRYNTVITQCPIEYVRVLPNALLIYHSSYLWKMSNGHIFYNTLLGRLPNVLSFFDM